MGYLNMEEKTLASFTDDGWFRTGDLGKRDEDGFLYVAGRIDGKYNIVYFSLTFRVLYANQINVFSESSALQVQ